MINRKEYSDLPAEQKIVYMKRNVIVGFVTLIPFIIITGVLFTGMFAVMEELEKLDDLTKDSISTNQTSIEQVTEETEVDLGTSLYMIGFLIIFVVAIISVIGEGGRWGNDIADKLKLYTDLDVERLEKELAKVKEVLK